MVSAQLLRQGASWRGMVAILGLKDRDCWVLLGFAARRAGFVAEAVTIAAHTDGPLAPAHWDGVDPPLPPVPPFDPSLPDPSDPPEVPPPEAVVVRSGADAPEAM